eukprot:2013093-Amphidinium_carterae.1
MLLVNTSLASAMYVRSMCRSATAAFVGKLLARTIHCASSSLFQHQRQSFAGLASKCKGVNLPQLCSVVLVRTDQLTGSDSRNAPGS